MVGTWQRLAHVELSSNGNLSTGTFTAKDNLKVVVWFKPTSANTSGMVMNNDTNYNYSNRRSKNGGSDETRTSSDSLAGIQLNGNYNEGDWSFATSYITNIATKEKLAINEFMTQNTAGAGTAPERVESVGKWTNTSDQITEIDITDGAGSALTLTTGSYITVFGASSDIITDEKTTLTNVPANTQYRETDTRKIYRFVTTSSSHSGGTSGSDDVSGIGADGSNPRGGWGQQIKTGHPLVGKKLKTLTVTTRLSSDIGGRSDKDMTVKVFAGTTSTIRGTSEAINTSTLTTAGTWYDKTFTFTNAVELSADDCICVCVDGDTGSSGGWNAKIKGSPEDTNKGYWVAFQDATNPTGGSIQTNRSMIYTATYEQDVWKDRGTA
tara:strand:+ start:270 stop:1412 length:1143 start_codon:yes stop_codon:yes gene_type:complete